ncbi:hypothetical protein CHLNCDRAFT_138698 [Chlorella variabilis]|uniref:Iron-sulfur cluster biosynthesis family protein n=1 Tax=Chlorella variabilis TaxID=554065 RepID=E1ZNK5_CHLVA|nr:hypothetical protein CHLNCDRAFT_138698 [Chlorella variabilis]EFN52698.1 hypothetical protein CHLNCDRAFT_138698 [Chlorella variabilis]|eukprot:XP_005844800.1 hypothetical protein CHLNCDRAFT_138698 [Chlorella variabilis]
MRLRTCKRADGARRSQVELLLDNVAGKGELLSPRLDPDVRQRAARAISQRGGRVTIGDVASTAGLQLDQAEAAVKALAADSQATLAVSAQGDIVYAFAPGFEAAIASKSLLLRLEPVAAGFQAGLEYLLRVAFGTALIASVMLVFLAITVLMSSASSRDDNRGGGRSGGGGGGGFFGPRVYFDLTDLLWYWDPFWYRNRRDRMAREQRPGGMNFLEAIFSWVFGDGDPNADFDKKRWQAIGRYIAARGGTVVAEELAPFLDLQPGQLAADRGRITVDESYMLPVLARFNGSPRVDASGNIVYEFPELQQTAGAGAPPPPKQRSAREARWQLTAASAGQKLGAVALGAVNLIGVGVLTVMLQDPVSKLALAQNGLLGVVGLMPWLQAYAAAFFAIPLFRWFRIAARNAAVDSRNEAREAAVALLQRPDPVLQQKLAGAAAAAKRSVITDRDVIYRSDQPLERQPSDLEAENFDARLKQRARERQPQGQQQQQEVPQPRGAAPQWWFDQQAQRQRDRS